MESNYDGLTYARPTCSRENLSQKFCKLEDKYSRQYAHIYFMRSELMKNRIESAAKKKWGAEINIKKLSDVVKGEKCCLLGTLFKIMPLQPSILKEISEEFSVPLQSERMRFTGEDDKLVLEDSMQRISLVGNIISHECFTGSIIAVLGHESEHGQFEVEDYTYPGLPPQTEIVHVPKDDEYVLFVSGLGIGAKKEKTMQIQLLIDYILGMLGGKEDHELCAKIIHVIVAGNSLSKDTLDKEFQSKAKYLTYKSEASSVKAMCDLDFFLSQLVPFVSVDIMSGEFDPTNHVLPQKPMHPCMFPSARSFHGSTFHSVSNPYECRIEGVHFLGTSGQNINNLYAYSTINDGLRLLSDTLQLQHLAPTAPDTLGSFPFYDIDPFIIDECPHVYFCGNQPHFASEVKLGEDGQKTLLLSIPEFSKTSCAVLLNLKDLTCEELCIDVDWKEEVDNMETDDPEPEK
ncbi:unnamed protein product [Clavelina lepadiformis]|uniref:DNA polymerase delta subunit 2 n=1 Tax=Clavelina lepadiformis TaxID=159417 RepID=A0ABP0FBE4_CLALP